MEFEDYVEEIGGWKVLKDSFEQFRKDTVFLDKHRAEWLKTYPDKWAAVFREELIAVDADLGKLMEAVKKRNIPRGYSEAVSFLSTKKIRIILSSRAVP